MLLYVDQPASIVGDIQSDEGLLRYDIRAKAAGYVWVREQHREDGGLTFSATISPPNVRLAVQIRESPDTAGRASQLYIAEYLTK
jgi:hypothetical protein